MFQTMNGEKDRLDFHHVFQPICALNEFKIYGYEALLRPKNFDNPELHFIDAKKNNYLFELDMTSIYRACLQYKRLSNKEELFVNICPSTIISSRFPEMMNEIIEDTTISPQSTILEISEAEKKEDLGLLTEWVNDLKNRGFAIALDDIGRGDSTLEAIIELDPDILKFDRFFARGIVSFQKKREYMRRIVEIFGKDKLIVLEGIETGEELKAANDVGITHGQGYFLGKPKAF
ncbi:EAL domain-containing protein [Virgibacillus sp. SK37]|uniref:EAL domain-containing protein n=1 Tax=Virgibacillus sp. SK37 TaxID=403957 RepID=UPI0004D1C4D3|nr:EAL domain-containing protein [Virgibacillus sp. SK37]AIF45522.1 hypothetical protein X953_15465 [Virgibacillus sp. SK37]